MLGDGQNQPSRAPKPNPKQVHDLLFGKSSTSSVTTKDIAPARGTTTLTATPVANENLPEAAAQRYTREMAAEALSSFTISSDFDPYGLQDAVLHDPSQLQARYQESMQAPARAEAMAARAQRDHQSPVESYTLTSKQYNALSPEQRAAVDFNTQLVAAREKDLNTEYHATDKQREQYHKEVTRLFGNDGGSYRYAPETLGLLEQIKLKPDAGQDMDNYLGLEAAVDIKELPKTGSSELGGALGDVLQLWTDNNPAEGERIQHHEKQLERRGSMAQDLDSSLQIERNRYLRAFGGKPDVVKLEPGWGSGALDTAIQKAFETFARSDVPHAQAQSLFDRTFTEPEWRQAFFNYADTMTRREAEYRSRKRSSDTIEYRSPQEFRELLGLDPVE